MLAAFLTLLVMPLHAAQDRLVFDFRAPTSEAVWQVVNDDVMGGVSTSAWGLTNGVAVFRGTLSVENNGGFASVRSAPARHPLSGTVAFVIRARGDGRRYKFTVRTDPGFDSPLYQLALVTRKGEWQEHRLALADFVPTFRGRVLADQPSLDPGRITSVGFLISDGQEGPFELQIAWIQASASQP